MSVTVHDVGRWATVYGFDGRVRGEGRISLVVTGTCTPGVVYVDTPTGRRISTSPEMCALGEADDA